MPRIGSGGFAPGGQNASLVANLLRGIEESVHEAAQVSACHPVAGDTIGFRFGRIDLGAGSGPSASARVPRRASRMAWRPNSTGGRLGGARGGDEQQQRTGAKQRFGGVSITSEGTVAALASHW